LEIANFLQLQIVGSHSPKTAALKPKTNGGKKKKTKGINKKNNLIIF
jgi:hypothetical protein